MGREIGTRNPDGGPLERRLARLITEASRLSTGAEQRRDTLIERAEASGLDRPDAEQAYDIAIEENLPPAYGIALIHQGISVQPLDGDGTQAEAAEPVEPEWIERAPDPAEAGREKRLRETFRRLRSFLDREGDPETAVAAFAREPDLELYDY